MPKHSKLSWTACGRLLPLMLAVVSLTACSSLSEMIKEANKRDAKPETKVAAVVAVPAKPEPQRLPEIPASLRKCLEAKVAKADAMATADDTVKALYAADRTKADCARKLFAWYRDRQPKQAAAAMPDGHPKTERKAPAATW